VADKPDSVEICFVPDGDHAALIRRRRPEAATAGKIVSRAGTVLAEHPGIENFTIGQRQGRVCAGERRYVLRSSRTPRRSCGTGATSYCPLGCRVTTELADGVSTAATVCVHRQDRYRHQPAGAQGLGVA